MMKQHFNRNIFLYLAIGLIGLFIAFEIHAYNETTVTYDNEALAADEDISFKKREITSQPEEAIHSIPVSKVVAIHIKEHNISRKVIPVGINEKGEIAVVNNAEDLVWYERTGNSIRNILIAGHRGWEHKRGTLFESEYWKKGLELEVTFENGDKQLFALTHKYKYSPEETPEDLLNTEIGAYRVTVMTCDEKGTERIYNIFTPIN